MLISTLSLGFCAITSDEEYVSTCFLPHQRGGVLVVFRTWRSRDFFSWIGITAIFVCLSVMRIASQL